MRVLVTGANGFVGPYFRRAMQKIAPQVEIVACGNGSAQGQVGIALDIRDEAAVNSLIAKVSPTHVMHLAGVSRVADAQANSRAAWDINVLGTLNLARAILRHAPRCILLSVASGEVYGLSANGCAALDENARLQPISEYAVTKAAADLAVGSLAAGGLRAIRLRPFNHVGPGQTEQYALSSFAAQIAKIELERQAPVISVGNLGVERDFLDVRDVAEAYAIAALNADEIPNGQILNIASGRAVRLSNLLDELMSMSHAKIKVQADSSRVRRSEVLRICGDASKAREILNWAPSRELKKTLHDILKDWRQRLSPNE
ncbi:GDP-mannose 4,6-dehydratase [Bradyrhizobium sp. MOS002]|uniref:GDP-mannose 4,6-dehydratase n=1 Tax=Bradyrhizobium sp. MOS002 TaxID=2133947 RepID=UPI000D1391A0|nr:GDP-mannose 4,6-dehydratase [Bradyrhizobium sp. MOS002]PSO23655.1 oxidoreductase [Bradyrhizobium sp. MOS002]